MSENLNRAFINDTNRMSGSLELNRCQQLLEVLSQARSLDTTQTRHTLDLSNHGLLGGKITGQADSGSGQLITWMSSVRCSKTDDQMDATFFFPENNLGPDLMFALKPDRSGRKTVLCLLQVRIFDTLQVVFLTFDS